MCFLIKMLDLWHAHVWKMTNDQQQLTHIHCTGLWCVMNLPLSFCFIYRDHSAKVPSVAILENPAISSTEITPVEQVHWHFTCVLLMNECVNKLLTVNCIISLSLVLKISSRINLFNRFLIIKVRNLFVD